MYNFFLYSFLSPIMLDFGKYSIFNFEDQQFELANIPEGLATLIAVFVGALLTILTSLVMEGIAQHNRKKEQIREQQIDSIKSIVHSMQKIDYLTIEVCIPLVQELFGLSSSLSPSQRKNKENNLKQQINDNRCSILEQKDVISQELWELRFLKYKDKTIKNIEAYLSQLAIVCELIKELPDNSYSVNKVSNSINVLKEQFTVFVKEAINGLT